MILRSFALTLLLSATSIDAFIVGNTKHTASTTPLPSFSWELYGKVKRGKGLGTLAEDGVAVSKSKTRRTPKRSANSKSKKNAPAEGNISPALAEWMASQEGEDGGDSLEAPATVTPNESGDEVASFQTFEKDTKANRRRVKQNARKEQDEKRNSKIDESIDALEAALEESNNLDEILFAVKSLLTLPSGNLRQLVAGKQKFNYRLAWVGSDDAICHVGTGLHKVPLARLQEVFMSCLGKSRLEILEVIRILGPFPNVKNTLQGNAKLEKSYDDNVRGLQIVMDSMVDGTGKEILAGTDDNIRRVNLQIYFCDERAIVAVVPPEEGDGLRANPLEDNGKNVLVFIRDDEMDDKLNALRVL